LFINYWLSLRGEQLKGRVEMQKQRGFSLTNDSRSQDSFSAVTQQLAALEKRDWELWIILCLAGFLVTVGLLSLVIPAAFVKQDEVRLQITVSRQLVLGLFVLLALLNSYLLTRRLELRRTRQKLISSTIQNELVRLQSFTDPLTEVYNRRSLEDMASRFISHAVRQQSQLTFLLIDVDRFKKVNTQFGHLTGDFVLTEVATLLRSSVRGSDAVVRYGGDEFLVILADAGALGARHVVHRIREYLADWNNASHLENFNLSFSIGISEWSDGKTLDEMLDAADRAMYAEKGSYNPELTVLRPLESRQT
jgi:diguanylate cyclase (GGDEF)-like protein